MGTGGLRGKWELTYANATVSATCLLNCRKEKEFDDSDASSFKVQQCHVDPFFFFLLGLKTGLHLRSTKKSF